MDADVTVMNGISDKGQPTHNIGRLSQVSNQGVNWNWGFGLELETKYLEVILRGKRLSILRMHLTRILLTRALGNERKLQIL